MLITQIDELNKGKIKIWLEDGMFLTVYKKEVRQLELKLGKELTEQQYKEIMNDILVPRAKKRAMHLLEKMDRTEMQLREKLKQNEYPEYAIDEAIGYVKNFHYIDDFRYACNYIRYRSKSKSRRQMVMELYRKGISKEDVQRAIDEESQEPDESLKIQKWLDKKKFNAESADVKEKQKIYQFLLRKGFQSQDIMKAICHYENVDKILD